MCWYIAPWKDNMYGTILFCFNFVSFYPSYALFFLFALFPWTSASFIFVSLHCFSVHSVNLFYCYPLEFLIHCLSELNSLIPEFLLSLTHPYANFRFLV